MRKIVSANCPVDTNELDSDVIMECRDIGICYRRPLKLGRRLTREAREYWPFRNLNLQLKRGETLGVVGRNGAGKSTLLRLLAGITFPDEGTFLRRPNTDVQLLTINLGFEPILTGRENALMGGMLLGRSHKYMMERMDLIKEFSGLGDFFEEQLYAYSSGMRARLGFSIATEIDPDVLLLDEVLSVGDAEFKEKSQARTINLINSGKSVVIVSHSTKFMNDLAHRVIEL